jgi:mxaJ protein
LRRWGRGGAGLLLALGLAQGQGHARAPERSLLRVCADPNNMPFSNAAGQGIENALARLVARELGADLRYTWMPQRRGFVRNTLKAGRCDVMMEVPVGYPRAATTHPYYRSTYVFVSRRDRHLAIRSFDDPALRRLRIGVQTIGDDYANSPPADWLARRGLAAQVNGFPVYGDYSKATPLASIMQAVVRGDVDLAVVWGPLGGWWARQQPIPLEITAAAGPDDPRGSSPLAFDIAMGVRRDDLGLRDRLDRVIAIRRAEIDALLRGFGVPLARRL